MDGWRGVSAPAHHVGGLIATFSGRFSSRSANSPAQEDGACVVLADEYESTALDVVQSELIQM